MVNNKPINYNIATDLMINAEYVGWSMFDIFKKLWLQQAKHDGYQQIVKTTD